MKDFNPKLYEILGRIPQHATQEEIKKAYRTLAKLYHADKNPDDKSYADEMMSKLNEAYEIISNPTKRAEYDQKLNPYMAEKERQERLRKQQEEAETRRKQYQEEMRRKRSQQATATKENVKSGAGALVGVLLGIVALGLLIDALS